MKKLGLFLFICFSSTVILAQNSIVAYDPPVCNSATLYSYTYYNYSLGGPTGPSGFKIYRNGVLIQDYYGSMSMSEYCSGMVFINDSTGFLIRQTPAGQQVHKTTDYGNTWPYFGGQTCVFMGFYPVNAHFGYLIGSGGLSFPSLVMIKKCSDIVPQSTFIYDDSLNTNIYKTDTIYGDILCSVDSLNIFIKNTFSDTIKYHIDFTSLPLGVNSYSIAKTVYSVYPNPTTGKLSVEGNDIYKLEVFSIQGNKIFESNLNTIDVSSYPNGLYFIRITDVKGNQISSKFIKQ